MKGYDLVNKVLREWESIVNRMQRGKSGTGRLFVVGQLDGGIRKN